jgi:antitoxin (DNA-binding transcriptional repressor) of toxin-antitoxin stability system
MIRIGLFELCQNAFMWVVRAAAGETIEITNRGHPVAVLATRPGGSMMERLIARGEMTPATTRLEDIEPLPAKPGKSLSRLLEEMR